MRVASYRSLATSRTPGLTEKLEFLSMADSNYSVPRYIPEMVRNRPSAVALPGQLPHDLDSLLSPRHYVSTPRLSVHTIRKFPRFPW
jgi:hypothetical protein